MRGEECAVAIVCMPCRRRGGYFVPVSDLVLASLDGTEQRHPAIRLAALVGQPDVNAELREHGVTRFLLIVDDLAVRRSWMLPESTASVEELWPAVRDSLERLLSKAEGIDSRVLRFSDVLGGQDRGYEVEVAETGKRFMNALSGPEGSLKAAMEKEIRRRRRFERETGRRDGEAALRRRAASQLANYAVQGRLMRRWNIAAYIPWTAEEISLMSLLEEGFASMVLSVDYGRSGALTTPAAAFPEGFDDLRKELELYITDLPRTPGAVRPGLVLPVVESLSKILTPGMRRVGEREVRAINEVLAGGPLNRARVRELLEVVGSRPVKPGWATEQIIKKLFCHLTARYNDEECISEYGRHREVVRELGDRLSAHVLADVALALTGSLTRAPWGIWHPYLSDIDVMPLFVHPPPPRLLESVRQAYAAVDRPEWVYLNEGARMGVAGMIRDPAQSLFVADRLAHLEHHEFAKLTRLATPMRHVGGSPDVFRYFVRTHRGELEARTHERPAG